MVEISLPQVESNGASVVQTNPIMKIGDFAVPEKDCNISEMFIEFIIYADNCNHILVIMNQVM